jgi:hypothetical protein
MHLSFQYFGGRYLIGGLLTIYPFRLNTVSAQFGICTEVGLNVTLVEAEIRTWDT